MEHEKERLRVVVACSEPSLRILLEGLFAASGAEVEGVGSHKALLGRVLRGDYDLVVTRFAEPLLDSPQGVATLRGRGLKTRLFLIADHLSAEASVALLERGVSQLFTLPISVTRLRAKMGQKI